MRHLRNLSKCGVNGPAVADSSLLIKEARIALWSSVVEALSDTLAFIRDLMGTE